MNDLIVCNIFNYKKDNNAKILYEFFKNNFYTTIIDTFHKEDGSVINGDNLNVLYLNNVYFGGMYKEAYRIAKEREARWILNITSDVEFTNENIEKLIGIINNEICESDDIGAYFVSAKEGSACFGTTQIMEKNKHLFNNNTGGIRDIHCGEDWFMLARTKNYHNAMSYYDDKYYYGWGIGWCINEYAKQNDERIVVDDRVEALHPYGTGYDREKANELYIEYADKYIESVYDFKTDIITKTFSKNYNDKDKFIVLTCAKNEDNYLVEFVEHYLKLGFDKIIIADNNDKPSIIKVLDKYLNNGTVEVLNCRGFGSFQVQLYAMFANEGNYQWCGYFDADEYLELNCYTNIKDFLQNINENSVSFNWINFGSNGEKHYNNKPIQERFKLPVPQIMYFKENCFVKSIVRGGDCWKGCRFNGSHVPYIEGNNDIVYNIGGYYLCNSMTHTHYPFRYKYGYIKHYYTKSFDEWVIKSNRGWPDGTDNLKMSTFFAYEPGNGFDFNRFIYAAFGNDSDYYNNIYENSEFHRDAIDNYSVIEISNESKIVYSLVLTIVSMMKSCTDHTFIVTDNTVDDSLYGMLLECAFYTGNRVVFAKNREEVWRAFLKYNNKNEDTYYIIKT